MSFVSISPAGTQVLPAAEGAEETLLVALVDSVYKNNEASRIAKFLEGAAAIHNAKQAGGGKSKRAQDKKKEEERIATEKIQKEIDDFIAALGPDGYLLLEARTNDLTPPPPNDTKIVISSVACRVMSSVAGGLAAEEEIYKNIDDPRPSPYQYVQAPDWLQKFSPGNMEGIFFHDEVTLVMRQDAVIRPILDCIEDDEMFLKICELYASSRLVDLARYIFF
jgi:hypothetical protein